MLIMSILMPETSKQGQMAERSDVETNRHFKQTNNLQSSAVNITGEEGDRKASKSARLISPHRD